MLRWYKLLPWNRRKNRLLREKWIRRKIRNVDREEGKEMGNDTWIRERNQWNRMCWNAGEFFKRIIFYYMQRFRKVLTLRIFIMQIRDWINIYEIYLIFHIYETEHISYSVKFLISNWFFFLNVIWQFMWDVSEKVKYLGSRDNLIFNFLIIK